MKPKVNNIPTPQFLPVEKKVLPNGAMLYSINGGTQDVVQIDIQFDGGKWTEPKLNVADFTAEMLTEGTSKHSSKELTEEFNFYGTDLSAFSGNHIFSAGFTTLTKHVSYLLPLLKEVLTQSIFPEKEFSILQNNATESLKVQLQKNIFVAQQEFEKTVFGENHPYGKKTNIESIKNLTTADLKDYFQSHINLKNLKIFVAGKFNEKILADIEKFFGQNDWGISKDVQHKTPISSSGKSIIKQGKGEHQAAIFVGNESITKTHSDHLKFSLLLDIFGGGSLNSRLMKNIREEKGYTYGIYANKLNFLDTGLFYVRTEVGKQYVEDTLKQINVEIEKLHNELIPEDELSINKKSYLGGVLSLFDTPFSQMGLVKQIELFNLNESYYQDLFEIINSTTSEELQKLAQKYLKIDEMLSVVIN